MKQLDSQLLSEFLNKAGEKLKGEWLLVGGTLLPAVGLDVRATVDIDIIGLGPSESAQILELMEISEQLGLPVETINQAAAFFLNKISYSKDDLLVLHKGKSSTIYRPSLMLYWQLKIGRLSETDLLDCQHYFHFCKAQKDELNKSKLVKILNASGTTQTVQEKLERLARLLVLAQAL